MNAVIICAAPQSDASYIKKYISDAALVLCADGGFRYARQYGISPDFIIGDMDSCGGMPTENVRCVVLNPHKDDTDTICCVEKAIESGCEDITLLCALGGRIDHTLANIAVLDYIQNRGAKGRIVSQTETVTMLKDEKYTVNGKKGKTFSLFAYNCEKCTVSYCGAEYPLHNYEMQSGYPIGVSNVFTSDFAQITVKGGKAIFIINEQI